MSDLLDLIWYPVFVAVVMCFMFDLWFTVVASTWHISITEFVLYGIWHISLTEIVLYGVLKLTLLQLLSVVLYGDLFFDAVLKEIVWTDTENQFWVVFWLSYMSKGMYQLDDYHKFLIVVRLVKAFGKFYKQQFSGHETCTNTRTESCVSRSMVAR